jgi:hypothetical protein
VIEVEADECTAACYPWPIDRPDREICLLRWCLYPNHRCRRRSERPTHLVRSPLSPSSDTKGDAVIDVSYEPIWRSGERIFKLYMTLRLLAEVARTVGMVNQHREKQEISTLRRRLW